MQARSPYMVLLQSAGRQVQDRRKADDAVVPEHRLPKSALPLGNEVWLLP
jgi:hypothetical protein